MPLTEVLLYRKADGEVPLLEWLEDLERKEPKAYAKCLERLLALSQLGYELRRPLADLLRDGIYELRCDEGNVNYRMLYFYYGKNAAVVSHGCTKESKVPSNEIERAIKRKKEVEADTETHTADFEI